LLKHDEKVKDRQWSRRGNEKDAIFLAPNLESLRKKKNLGGRQGEKKKPRLSSHGANVLKRAHAERKPGGGEDEVMSGAHAGGRAGRKKREKVEEFFFAKRLEGLLPKTEGSSARRQWRRPEMMKGGSRVSLGLDTVNGKRGILSDRRGEDFSV